MMIFINQLIFEGIHFTDYTIINHFVTHPPSTMESNQDMSLWDFFTNGDPDQNMGVQTPLGEA